MQTRHALAVLALVPALTACGQTDDRQWMKINERYTTEQFRRDYTECSAKAELDDACMKNRGWVEVTRSKSDRDTDPRTPEQSRPHSQRGGFSGLAVPTR